MNDKRLKISQEKLLRDQTVIEQLNILSFDSGIYLAELLLQDGYYMLTDNAGNNRVFRGAEAAKRIFGTLAVKQTTLQHQSSYDEMIGLSEENTSNLLKVATRNPE